MKCEHAFPGVGDPTSSRRSGGKFKLSHYLKMRRIDSAAD
jgi:hypothetical protein